MIFVDSRESRSPIPTILTNMKVPWTYVTMQVADYVIKNQDVTVAIERKTIEDYMQSKRSGHLDTQLAELSQNYDESYIAIIGYLSRVLNDEENGEDEDRITRPAFYSSLIGTTFKRSPDGKKGTIKLLAPFESEHDFALTLKFLHEKIMNKDYFRFPRMQKIKFTSGDRLVYVLSSFRNIGKVKATNLLLHFGTLSKLMQAPASEIAKVSKVSEKDALSMWKLMNEEYKQP